MYCSYVKEPLLLLSKGFLFITRNPLMSSYHSVTSMKQESIEKTGVPLNLEGAL